MTELPWNFAGKYIETDDGCWLWTAARIHGGYGCVSHNGKTALAHRVAWTSLRGPIPPGLTIDHLCRVKACINPDHMEVVTYRENTMRRHLRAVTHCPRGHEYTEENTYYSVGGASKVQCKSCRTCKREANARRRRREKATGGRVVDAGST